MHRQKRNNKPYRLKKTGVKDENIDRQILAIHQAMVSKLLKHPELIAVIRETLETRRENGRYNHSQYITWFSILDMYDKPQRFRDAVLEDTPRMRRLRRNTPFIGILTEQERQQALYGNAIGDIDDIQTVIY